MAIRYSSAQLLKLRESPLVAKPTNLPPIEEWMGQSTDSNQRRSNSSNIRNDGQSKTLPKMGNGGILLGPPKSSFISSSSSSFKTANGPFDSGRSTFGNFGSDTARSDHNSKGRYNDRQTGEGDDRPQRGTGRRSDSNWAAGLEDDEKGYHRSTGREGDGDGQDGRRRGYDNQRRDDDTRRNGAGRANRPSWLRDDDPPESRSREGVRSNDWRDAGARRGQDRGWNRPPLVERDEEPEWMVGDPFEEKKGRTVQDMEEWKASMKAREKGTATAESAEPSIQHSRNTSNTIGKVKTETPLMLDPSLDDKFFGFMNTPSATGGASKADTLGKGTKSSKFSGLFGPQTPAGLADAIAAPPPPAPSGPASAPPDPVNDDRAGFQRILAMLNAPQPSSGSLPPNAPPQQRQATPSGDTGALKPANSPPPIISPRSRRPGAFDNLLGMQSPDEGPHRPQAQSQPQPLGHPHGPLPPSNKDADFLLTLLRTRDGDGPGQGPPPGLGGRNEQQFHGGPPAGRDEQGHPAGHGPGGGMFDDFGGAPRHRGPSDPPQSNAQHQPPSQPGPPSQRYEDDDHERRGGGDYPPHFPPMGMPGPPPPGLGRPPGFEGMPPPPPPGFPQYMHSPPHGGMVGPPPGFGNRPPPHGHTGPGQHNAFPPGFLPGLGSMSLNERGGNGGGGGPPYGGPPPGNMRGPGPPPGFMGMNGPPPGFPPHEGFPGGGPPPGHGPPPPPGRMLELFGEGRGGPGGPGSHPPLGQQGMQLQGQGQFRRE